ncbi:MAG: cytochrome c [Nitrospirae bacterium]|nr:cytochrome c [Nitrospirota bacterium]
MSGIGKRTLQGLIAGMLAVGILSPAFAQDATHGKKVYDTNCAACHGAKGDGKGPAAATLNPKPTDFTSPEVMKDIPDPRMKKSIREGKPGTAMVAWGGILSDKDIEDVIAYTRTFREK